jgi:hypothetical protein
MSAATDPTSVPDHIKRRCYHNDERRIVDTAEVFFIFAVIGVIALFFVFTQAPETRGRSLETLEDDVETGAIFNFRRRASCGSSARTRARRCRCGAVGAEEIGYPGLSRPAAQHGHLVTDHMGGEGRRVLDMNRDEVTPSKNSPSEMAGRELAETQRRTQGTLRPVVDHRRGRSPAPAVVGGAVPSVRESGPASHRRSAAQQRLHRRGPG